MTSIASSPLQIQASTQSVPALPCWFGELTLIIHHMQRQGVLAAIEKQVHFARRLLTTLRVDRFCGRAVRLCKQRGTDA